MSASTQNSEKNFISLPTKLWPFLLISAIGHLSIAIIYFSDKKEQFMPPLAAYPINIIYVTAEEEIKKTSSNEVKPLSLKSIFKSQGENTPKNTLEEIALNTPIPKNLALKSGNPHPPYPLPAQQQAIEGKVQINLGISKEGNVEKIEVLSPKAHPLLEKAVIETVKIWKFQSLDSSYPFIEKKYEFVFKLED